METFKMCSILFPLYNIQLTILVNNHKARERVISFFLIRLNAFFFHSEFVLR